MYEVSEQLDALANLEAAAAQLLAGAGDSRTPEQLADELPRLARVKDRLALVFAIRAGQFAVTDYCDADAGVSPYQWIRDECKVSGGVAGDALAVAASAKTLPASVAALEAGRIGFAHLALVAHTACAVAQSPAAGPFDERPLLRQAERHSVSRFRRDCAHARHAADAGSFLNEHVDAVEARFLHVTSRDDGCVWLRGFFDSVSGAGVRTVLESLGRREGPDDIRTRQRRNADALDELLSHALSCPGIAAGSARAPQLMVTASIETLRGTPGAPAADLEFAGPIPAETARRLACDANVINVQMDADGNVADVGRSRRMPNTATRRKLALRDGGCVWPGCDRPASWTVPHHLLHWAHGGDHELPNLVSLCTRHHRKVHEGGWQLLITDDRRVLTLAPNADPPRARPPTTTAA